VTGFPQIKFGMIKIQCGWNQKDPNPKGNYFLEKICGSFCVEGASL